MPVTGFFMLDPEKEMTPKKLFFKYLARIVCALFFWSFFYAFTFHRPYFPLASQTDHLWYLSMLIGLYLSIPVLRVVARNKKVLKFTCWCWLALMFVAFIGKFHELPVRYLDYGVYAEYPGYCLFAYLLKTEYSHDKKVSIIIYVLGIIGLLATVLIGLSLQTESSPFFSDTSPNVIASALALFLLFTRNELKISGKAAQMVEEVSRCTFGIYLVHIWILTQIFTRVHRFIPQPIPLCIICVGMAFVGGLIITWIIRRIPILKRYIV